MRSPETIPVLVVDFQFLIMDLEVQTFQNLLWQVSVGKVKKDRKVENNVYGKRTANGKNETSPFLSQPFVQ